MCCDTQSYDASYSGPILVLIALVLVVTRRRYSRQLKGTHWLCMSTVWTDEVP